MSKVLEKLFNNNIGVICSSLDEAKYLFSIPFGREIRDLTGGEPYEREYETQGFIFKDAPYNSYASGRWLQNEAGYSTISLSSLIFNLQTEGVIELPTIPSNINIKNKNIIPKTIKFKKLFHTFDFEGRKITLCVKNQGGHSVSVGYSVKIESDKFDQLLAEKISSGRADSKARLESDTISPTFQNSDVFKAIATTWERRIRYNPTKYIKGIKITPLSEEDKPEFED